jgi:hypothetical protein
MVGDEAITSIGLMTERDNAQNVEVPTTVYIYAEHDGSGGGVFVNARLNDTNGNRLYNESKILWYQEGYISGSADSGYVSAGKSKIEIRYAYYGNSVAVGSVGKIKMGAASNVQSTMGPDAIRFGWSDGGWTDWHKLRDIMGTAEAINILGYTASQVSRNDKIVIEGNLVPQTTLDYSLGIEGRSWVAVWVKDGVCSNSDRREKQDIV